MPELTAKTFEKLIRNEDTIALITFYASWCAPCRLQLPVIEAIEKEYQDPYILIGTIDVDQEEGVANELEVRTIPCTLLYANGEMVEALSGFQQEEFLRAYLDHLITAREEQQEIISGSK